MAANAGLSARYVGSNNGCRRCRCRRRRCNNHNVGGSVVSSHGQLWVFFSWNVSSHQWFNSFIETILKLFNNPKIYDLRLKKKCMNCIQNKCFDWCLVAVVTTLLLHWKFVLLFLSIPPFCSPLSVSLSLFLSPLFAIVLIIIKCRK